MMKNVEESKMSTQGTASYDDSEEGEWHESRDSPMAKLAQESSGIHSPLLRCSEAEKAEAMALILEIMSLDMDLNPAELIHAGIRADVVRLCYKELGFSTGKLDNLVASSSAPRPAEDAVAANGVNQSSNASPVHAHALPMKTTYSHGTNWSLQSERDQERKWMELQHRTAILEEQRRILQDLRNGQERKETLSPLPEATTPLSSSSSSPLPPSEPITLDAVKAMRQAAIDSMKRKRAAAHKAISADEQSTSKESALLHETPKAPRQRRYRDVDAPSTHEQSIEEEAAAALALDRFSSEVPPLDPRQAQRAHVSYKDEFAPGVSVPTGQVDYSAPLPHLEIRQTRSHSPNGDQNHHITRAPASAREEKTFVKSRPGMTGRVQGGRIRKHREHFLPPMTSRVIVAVSDDSSDDDDDGSDCAEDVISRRKRRQIQDKNTNAIYVAWRKELGLDVSPSTPMSPVTPQTPIDASNVRSKPLMETDALLRKKEEEIEQLKRRMRVFEQRRTQADTKQSRAPSSSQGSFSSAAPSTSNQNGMLRPSPAEQAAADRPSVPQASNAASHDKSNEAAGRRQSNDADESPSSTSAAALPAYESLFSRHPGLRSVIGSKK